MLLKSKRWMDLIKNEKGYALVLITLCMTVIMAVTALVVDVGLMFTNKIMVANAADAAALAGVQALPADAVQAEALAREYAARNRVEDLDVSFDADNRAIEVIAQKTIDLFFARTLGFVHSTASARAKAAVEPCSGVTGVVPLGVPDQEFVFGEPYVLKYAGGDTLPDEDYHSGWLGILALQGPGAKLYLDDLMHGFDQQLELEDIVNIQTGNISGNTYTGIQYRIDQCDHIPYCSPEHYDPGCARVLLVPVIEPYADKQVRVIGFSAFLVDAVEGMGSENYITGHFIEHTISGLSDPSGPDNGIYVPRLVN